MDGLTTSVFAAISVVYLMVSFVRSELSLSDDLCISRGFNRVNLQCSSCLILDDYELKVLKNDCLECCSGDLIDQSSNSTVQAFIKSDEPGKHPNLQIKYKGGQLPQIVLYEDEGVIANTMSIQKWDTDTIKEFINTYLEPAVCTDIFKERGCCAHTCHVTWLM
ncbi:unnamed protein product [Allacma fusca]|uniref:Selenoprotein F/M domain-containing protein n=1 Tax=Allacma fusca TaxID=39272 RepID=A0A8J2PVS2_9HEXA|nr:unnamed protein product [Allacma fusca]